MKNRGFKEHEGPEFKRASYNCDAHNVNEAFKLLKEDPNNKCIVSYIKNSLKKELIPNSYNWCGKPITWKREWNYKKGK